MLPMFFFSISVLFCLSISLIGRVLHDNKREKNKIANIDLFILKTLLKTLT